MLDLAISDYIHLDPYVARVEDQPEAQGYRVTANLRYPPPPQIAHIVGDALNSLQGTLDYLAAELVLREGDVPDLATFFPIIKPAKDDDPERRVNIKRTGEDGRGRVPIIKDEAVLRLLRDVQPYNNGDQWAIHPLQLLRTLNGASKHRHPPIVAAAIYQGHYAYLTEGSKLSTLPPSGGPIPSDANVMMLTANFSPLHDGDEIAWVPYATAPEGGPPEHTEFTTYVAVEEAATFPHTGAPLTAVNLLTDIANVIEHQVLTPFAPLFGFAAPGTSFMGFPATPAAE